uniref:Ovule protein n=1 Tax=Strongyloides venezuelensis TaxID=75913 RepID=A0A0K0FRS3_STRVS
MLWREKSRIRPQVPINIMRLLESLEREGQIGTQKHVEISYALKNNYLSQDESEVNIFEDENKILQDVNSILIDNDGRTQADGEENTYESGNKESKITDTVVSKINNNLEKHVTLQVGNVDKNDREQQVDDSKNMEEKVCNKT